VGDVFSAVPAAVAAFSAANRAAAAAICGAGSADSQCMLAAATAALGPIEANYRAACAPAQTSQLTATLPPGHVDAATGGATDGSKTAIAADNTWRRR
jgi:hypothetical protein